MAQYLWTFQSVDGNPVPTFVPPGVNGSFLQSMKDINTMSLQQGGGGVTFTPVDVVSDFYWTNSKLLGADGTGRQEVPYIKLKERTVKTSSFVAQALYSAGGIFDSAKTVLNALNLGSFDNTSATQLAPAIGQKLSELLPSSTAGTNANSGSLMDTVSKKINEAVAAATDDSSFLTDPWLSYYKGLYITQPTGWVYFFPYMANSYQSTSNSWGNDTSDAGGGFLFEGASQLMEKGAEIARKITSSLSVGSFQEKAKFYQHEQNGETITVTFPLINTGNANFNDVIRNWQLVFLLLYQNRMQRIDRNIINPPPIYEVEIPGLKYMPLCYLSNIEVKFKGSRRTMTLPLPSATGQGNLGLNTVVPEAYEITLSITSLVAESKNFMYSTVFKNNNITVMTAAERNALNSTSSVSQAVNLNLGNSLAGLQQGKVI